MLWFLVAGFTAVFLAHTAPFPFLLEHFAPVEICMACVARHWPADNLS